MVDLAQRQKLILNIPCFSNLLPNQAMELAELMEEVNVEKEEVIVSENDVVDSVYLILKGQAEVTQERGKSNEYQLIATLGEGEWIGLNELGFFSTTGLRTATVTATSNMNLLRLTISNFNQFLQHYPFLNKEMARSTNQMLQLKFIKQAAPFIQFSKGHVQSIMKRIKENKVPARKIIFREGEYGDRCYLICSGKIEIFITDDEGENHVLAELEAPSMFGELALLTSAPRNASARALVPSELLELKKEDFIELISDQREADAITSLMLERERLIFNKKVIVQQRQTDDGEVLIMLKNPTQNTYYQFSKEGWFVCQQMNGNQTLQEISKMFKKVYPEFPSDYVYQLCVDLVKGGFAKYSMDEKTQISRISVMNYDNHGFQETSGERFEDCFPIKKESGITWVNIEGLNNPELIVKLAKQYRLHPLTVEDILNVDQRPKVETFGHYVFITLKALTWQKKHHRFQTKQISFVLGKDFVISFAEHELFTSIRESLHLRESHYMREQGADYLIYKLMTTIVEKYFIVLEEMGEYIETIEELILKAPTPKQARNLYKFKRQMLLLRKAIWPVREVVSRLLYLNEEYIRSSTSLYFRDLYDHVAQAIDTLETFRDMMAGMLDVYLSSLSMRTNDIMKILTIISTIFIPVTAIASIFGMNFVNMPELHWRWGFFGALSIMFSIAVVMLVYFKRKHWI